MSGDALIFQRIRVDRVPGVQHGEGYTIDSNDLSSGINIVYGPNGSGKSTTARVIHELIWPGQTGVLRATASADFQWQSDQWHVDLDSGHPVWQRDGQAADGPEAGPAETRHRYRLALHELVHDRNAMFAKAVADATQGGFDLETAAEALEFRENAKVHRTQHNRADAARRHLLAALERQSSIEVDARQLEVLERQRRDAVVSAQRIECMNRALEYRKAREESEHIARQLSEFSPQMTVLTGREQEQLDQYAQRHDRLDRQRQKQLDQVAGALRQQADTGLTEQGVAAASLRELRAACASLSDLERQIVELRRQIEDSGEQAAVALRRIGSTLAGPKLEQLQRVEIGELSDLARSAEHLRAAQCVMQQRSAWLSAQDESHATGAEADPQKMHQGIMALGQWLATPTPPGAMTARAAWLLAVTGGFGFVLVIVLGMLYHPAWLILFPVGPVLALLGRTRAGHDPRQVHRESYEHTGLVPPATWRSVAVAKRTLALAEAISTATLAGHRRQLKVAMAPRARELQQRVEAFEQQREQMRQRLGVAIDFEIGDEWLAVLADNVSTWQQHATRAQGARAPLRYAESEVENILGTMNQGLALFGYGAVNGSQEASLALDDLVSRDHRFVDAANMINTARDTLSRSIEPELAAVERDRAALFDRLGLDEADEKTLKDWITQRDEYVQLVKDRTAAEAVARSAATALADETQLLEMDRIELDQMIAAARDISARRDGLGEQIATIKNHIDDAKRGHDVTEALAQQQECIDRLSDLRAQDCKSVVGRLLVDHVRRICARSNRPQVFKRSNALLAVITHGALQLEFDDRSAPPMFMARDEAGQARPIDELSTGERVQLLMAVRMGFVETEESPMRLPLLMDETLGTSDDRRTAAIIDTVIEIARTGRQVFYFTAQNDEVGKWVERLREAQVPYGTVDLAAIRTGARRDELPLPIAHVETASVPAPDGLTYEQYGRRLGVPGLDPATGSVGRVHLWHILDAPDALYDLLQRGVTTWGQLRTLMDAGGGGLTNSGSATLQHARIAAHGIEIAYRVWRIGRGKPVDRGVLLDSGCVTDRFIDRMTDLADRFGRSADKLLSALDGADRPARWPGKSTQKLREYLEMDGFVDRQSRLPLEELRLRVMGALDEDLGKGGIEQAWIDRMVALLPK